MFSHPNRLLWLFLLVFPLCSAASSQDGNKPLLIGARDKEKENVIANLFNTVRADAKLPALTRIKHRDSLEQTVCSVAQRSTLRIDSFAANRVFYKTAQPEAISTELGRVASFKQPNSGKNLFYPRYSVAVWKVKDSETGETAYWVGVELYLSSTEEFLDNFTDEVFYRNEWKKEVAAQCRGK
jgi:hypothetical protein